MGYYLAVTLTVTFLYVFLIIDTLKSKALLFHLINVNEMMQSGIRLSIFTNNILLTFALLMHSWHGCSCSKLWEVY